MGSNTITCGNCLTENPPDQDFCIECGLPLTASAEEGMRENLDAQEHGSLIGSDDVPGVGIGGTGIVGGVGGAAAPLVPDAGERDRPTREW